MAHHHGETSLFNACEKLSENYTGSNNETHLDVLKELSEEFFKNWNIDISEYEPTNNNIFFDYTYPSNKRYTYLQYITPFHRMQMTKEYDDECNLPMYTRLCGYYDSVYINSKKYIVFILNGNGTLKAIINYKFNLNDFHRAATKEKFKGASRIKKLLNNSCSYMLYQPKKTQNVGVKRSSYEAISVYKNKIKTQEI